MHVIITMYQWVCICFRYWRAFLRPPSVCSHILGCSARKGAAWTPRRKLVSRAGSVARALGEVAKSGQYSRGFRGARAAQNNGKPICQLFCSTAVKALYLMAATVQEHSHIKFVWTTTMCVWTFHIRVACVLRYVRVYVRAGLCMGVLEPHISAFYYSCSACCCCCCRIVSPSHRSASSLSLYFVVPTVQQQSHSKFVWSTIYLLCVC